MGIGAHYYKVACTPSFGNTRSLNTQHSYVWGEVFLLYNQIHFSFSFGKCIVGNGLQTGPEI